jgi:hypothetical protein
VLLKPQDILVTLKLVLMPDPAYTVLAASLGMSASEVHASVRRASLCGLVSSSGRRPIHRALEEFLVHGAKYVLPAERGGMTRGMLTGYAAPPLRGMIIADGTPPPVWPDAEGDATGTAFEPIYRSVPFAARQDPALYELLVLVDALRGGRAREVKLAHQELSKRLA